MPTRAAILTAAGALAVGVLTSACGDDDTSSNSATAVAGPATSTADEQLCEDREALQDSIAELGDVDVVAEGVTGLQDVASDVEDSLQALRSSASASFQTEVDAVSDALDGLHTAIGDVDTAGVTGVASAARSVVTSADSLLQSLQNVDC